MTSLFTRATRKPALPVAAVALTAAVAGGIVWEATDKTVTLTVDGETREVDFRGSTTADVLAAAGVDADERDLLVPAASASVEDGGEVALQRARPLELVVDGEARTVWVTATSVDEALDQAGLRERGVALSASRSREIPLEGMSVAVRTPKDISIVADGTTVPRTTIAATARDALIEAGVHLDGDDRLSVLRARPVEDGLRIVVTRVNTDRVIEKTEVPFTTERREDDDLLAGTTKVVAEGREGRVHSLVQRTFADGALEKRTVVESTTVASPVTRVVAVGTKPRPAPQPAQRPSSGGSSSGGSSTGGSSSGGSSSGGSSSGGSASGAAPSGAWAAVAQCESGGNPSAVSSTGKYRGLYQFSRATWASVGGTGDPAAASVAEQTRRAQMLLARSGAGQWPECGRYLR